MIGAALVIATVPNTIGQAHAITGNLGRQRKKWPAGLGAAENVAEFRANTSANLVLLMFSLFIARTAGRKRTMNQNCQRQISDFSGLAGSLTTVRAPTFGGLLWELAADTPGPRRHHKHRELSNLIRP